MKLLVRLVAAAILLCAVAPQAGEPLAVVVRLKGDVKVGPSGGLRVAKSGDIIQDGWRIQAGPEGRALLRFVSDQSFVEIKPGTIVDLFLKESEDRTSLRRVFIRSGEAAFGVTPGKGKTLRAETATTVASVRGTRWMMSVNPDGESELVVTEGQVEVCNQFTGERALVPAGSVVRSGYDSLSSPSTLGEDEMRRRIEAFESLARRLEVDFVDRADGRRTTVEVDFRATP